MHTKLEQGFALIVEWLKDGGYSTPEDLANLSETPRRAAEGFREIALSMDKAESIVAGCLMSKFPLNSPPPGAKIPPPKEIIHGITVTGVCPHHLLPVLYDVAIQYEVDPKFGEVLGLSKYARIAKALASRPVLQETFVRDLAAVLTSGWYGHSLGALGAIVLARGRHMCAVCRGVKQHGFQMVSYIGVGSLDNDFSRLMFMTTLNQKDSNER